MGRLSVSNGDRSLAGIGGAERPLASAGLEGGVPASVGPRRGLGWVEVTERLERRLEERVRPSSGTGGSVGRLLSVRQERLGETSGELSMSKAEAGVVILEQ